MTAWLSGWLRDIVLILLLAAFVDLLVPNNALQRYVKVVISLIVLLTILSPVISLLKAESAVRRAAELSFEPEPAGQTGLPALYDILEQGGRMKQEADKESARWVEAQMGEMIGERLVSQFAVKPASVQVALAADDSTGQAAVKGIRIVLAASDAAGDEPGAAAGSPPSGQAAASAGIEPVEPVAVRVRVDGREDRSATPPPSPAPASTQDEHALMRNRIKQEMRLWWGVDERIVEVRFAED